MACKELIKKIKTKLLTYCGQLRQSTQAKQYLFLHKTTVCIIAVVLVITTVTAITLSSGWFYNLQSVTNGTLGEVNPISAIEPTKNSDAGMDVKTKMIVQTTRKMSVDELRSSLEITPKIEYKVSKMNSKKFVLSFPKALRSNTVYQISSLYEGTAVYRWAFQTHAQSAFTITETLPRNKDLYTPVDTVIELTFSHLDVRDLEDNFSISPKVKGKFYPKNKKWLFVPEENLLPETNYTVTVKKGVNIGGTVKLKEDYVFTFKTDSIYQDEFFSVDSPAYGDTFTSDAAPICVLISREDTKPYDTEVNVYQFSSPEQYIEHIKNNAKEELSSADKAKLQKAMTFKATASKGDSEYYLHYPSPLPQGYYLSEIFIDGYTRYHFFQVNDLAVYALSTTDAYTVWVNDTKTDKPAAGLTVKILGGKSGKTDKNGLTSIAANLKDQDNVRLVSVGTNTKHPLIAQIKHIEESQEQAYRNDYYTYLYTDRSIYHPNDKIRVWGVIKPRKKGISQPKSVSLAIDDFPDSTKVDLKADGTFTQTIPLQDMISGYASICLKINNAEVRYEYIEIDEYEKPLYSFDVVRDKNAYFMGEETKAYITSTYLDGTPAANLKIIEDDEIIYTNQEGKLTWKIKFKPVPMEQEIYYNYSSWMPDYRYVQFESGEDEEDIGSVQYLEQIPVFPMKTMVQGTTQVRDGLVELSIKSHRIDLSRINNMTKQEFADSRIYEDSSYYMGKSVDIPVRIDVHEISYKKTKTDTYYDPINKVWAPVYNYERKDKVIKTLSAKTVNGTCTLIDLPYTENSEKETRYYFEIRYQDEDGKWGNEIVFAESQDYDYWYSYSPYYFIASKNSAKLGETVDVNIIIPSKNSALVKTGTVLCAGLGDGVVDTKIYDKPQFQYTFNENNIPGVILLGAYFDGKHIYEVCGTDVRYDFSERKLSVSVTPDKEQYRPGDKVTLDINVTDQQGTPRAASVNISVVDEAVFMIRPHPAEILESLYTWNKWDIDFDVYTSYRLYQYGEGGGGGGDDGSSVRKDFEDSPAFLNVTTDKKGKATVTFELPDNLTTWQITTQAVTKDVYAGMSTTKIVASIPFFSQVLFSSKLKTADDVNIAMRSDGTAAKVGQTVLYKVTVNDGKKTVLQKSIKGAAASYQNINLGKLKKGSYKVLVESTLGKNKDAVELPLEIVEALLTVPVTTFKDVGKNTNLGIDAKRSPVTVLLYDKQMQFYMDAINRVSNSYGARVDQKLGMYKAAEYYRKYVGTETEGVDWEGVKREMQEAYQRDGGINLFPYSEGDLALSIKVAACVPDLFKRDGLAAYFNWIINDEESSEINVYASYCGLAAMGEPVLLDLKYLYKNYHEKDGQTLLYFALGFAYAGDFITANDIYKNNILPKLKKEKDSYYYNADDIEQTEELTGLSALVASRISASQAEGLIRYLSQHDPQQTLLNLELIAFLDNNLPLLPGKNKVSYTIDGKKQAVEFNKLGVKQLILTNTQAKTAKFTADEGDILVQSSYIAPITALKGKTDSSVILKRNISKQIKKGNTVKVSFEVYVPNKYTDWGAVLTDILPAGLKYINKVENRYDEEEYIYPVVDGQKLSFWLAPGHYRFDVYCKAAYAGEYLYEPSVITTDQNDRYALSKSYTIHISK